MILTYMKKIRHSMRRVTGVCLRDIANTIKKKKKLHLNVNHLSVCSSCAVIQPVLCSMDIASLD